MSLKDRRVYSHALISRSHFLTRKGQILPRTEIRRSEANIPSALGVGACREAAEVSELGEALTLWRSGAS